VLRHTKETSTSHSGRGNPVREAFPYKPKDGSFYEKNITSYLLPNGGYGVKPVAWCNRPAGMWRTTAPRAAAVARIPRHLQSVCVAMPLTVDRHGRWWISAQTQRRNGHTTMLCARSKSRQLLRPIGVVCLFLVSTKERGVSSRDSGPGRERGAWTAVHRRDMSKGGLTRTLFEIGEICSRIWHTNCALF